MMNARKFAMVLLALSTGISILFLELVFLCAGAWKEWIAAFHKPVDIFSESCDRTQLEEMDVVSSTITVLYGKYDYVCDDYVNNVTYYYILPVETTDLTYYIGIRETKGRKDKFRALSVQTEYDVRPAQVRIISGSPFLSDTFDTDDKKQPVLKEPIFVEGFLRRMSEQQYKRYLTWLEKAGYLEGTQGQERSYCIPYYIEERDLAGYKKSCVGGLIGIAVSVVLITGSTTVMIRWRKRRRNPVRLTIDGKDYTKEQLAGVNQLVCNIELMQAVQELSRITGLDLVAAEKIVRCWDVY